MPTLCRLWLLTVCLLIHGCARAAAPLPSREKTQAEPPVPVTTDGKATLPAATAALSARRIVRNAELSLEVESPSGAEQAATAIAEKLGGFTVSSERHQYGDGEGQTSVTIDLVMRVPAEQFQPALAQLRALSKNVASEKITGQDVTEEFIDLEARIRTERALEAQYLDILKDAKSVKDALDVHTHLADVREQIEKAEGRKHFLENQTSLSTIHVEIRKYVPEIRTSGFGFSNSLRLAAGDLVRVSAGIVTGVIRALGILLPILVILGIPAYYVVRFVRAHRRRRARGE